MRPLDELICIHACRQMQVSPNSASSMCGKLACFITWTIFFDTFILLKMIWLISFSYFKPKKTFQRERRKNVLARKIFESYYFWIVTVLKRLIESKKVSQKKILPFRDFLKYADCSHYLRGNHSTSYFKFHKRINTWKPKWKRAAKF